MGGNKDDRLQCGGHSFSEKDDYCLKYNSNEDYWLEKDLNRIVNTKWEEESIDKIVAWVKVELRNNLLNKKSCIG